MLLTSHGRGIDQFRTGTVRYRTVPYRTCFFEKLNVHTYVSIVPYITYTKIVKIQKLHTLVPYRYKNKKVQYSTGTGTSTDTTVLYGIKKEILKKK